MLGGGGVRPVQGARCAWSDKDDHQHLLMGPLLGSDGNLHAQRMISLVKSPNHPDGRVCASVSAAGMQTSICHLVCVLEVSTLDERELTRVDQ
jgi:hypothetical protein